MAKRDIVVVGGSLGGIEAASQLLEALPPQTSAALYVVVHSSSGSIGEVLGRYATLPVQSAVDGHPIEPGRVTMPVADHHLLLTPECVRTVRGPRENGFRPAVDPLFRSAAASFGPRVIGVVLSGLLDDGSAGLRAIARCGGVTVVQDPKDAIAGEMPRNAMAAGPVDHCAAAGELAELVTQLSREEVDPRFEVPADLRLERDLVGERALRLERVRRLGKPAPLGCPECGGPLWELHDEPPRRYRCHTGHAYTEAALLLAQSREAQRSVLAALRILEERARMFARLARESPERGRESIVAFYRERADEAEQHAGALHALIEALD